MNESTCQSFSTCSISKCRNINALFSNEKCNYQSVFLKKCALISQLISRKISSASFDIIFIFFNFVCRRQLLSLFLLTSFGFFQRIMLYHCQVLLITKETMLLGTRESQILKLFFILFFHSQSCN